MSTTGATSTETPSSAPNVPSASAPCGRHNPAGLRFNIHNDSPVVPPDILRLVWCAVERRTRSGAVLGPDQAIDVMAALRAVTIDAAYAHFEEDTKGSIAPGKLADLVVLGADPARVAPSELAAIPIIETLKEGVTIYPRAHSAK